jgi:hypothetical protein
MQNSAETLESFRARSWIVLFDFAVLMGLAYLYANTTMVPKEEAHSVTFYNVITTIWVTTVLLTPALCFHFLSVMDSYWRAFWTFAYLAFLAHLYWTVGATFHFDFWAIFHSQEDVATNPERIVDHPGPDFLLTIWWGIDVLLAWVTTNPTRLIFIQRRAVHILAFVMFFGATVIASKAEIVARSLGIIMVLAVVNCLVERFLISRLAAVN